MADIVIGLVVLTAISVVAFSAATRVSSRSSARGRTVLAAGVIVLVGVYLAVLWDSAALARMLPWSNLIVVGNWFPIAAALLAGVCWGDRASGPRARIVYPALLVVLSNYSVVAPLIGKAPTCENVWTDDGICVQTADATCSAACAATLLRMYGIEATEQEMAKLCVTREGTRWQGLYRGLKRKTAGTDWDVRVEECSAEEAANRIGGPMIAAVGIGRQTSRSDFYRSEWGWMGDRGHSVIVAGPGPCGWFEVIDPNPDYGRGVWSPQTITDLWQSRVIRLVPRDSEAVAANVVPPQRTVSNRSELHASIR